MLSLSVLRDNKDAQTVTSGGREQQAESYVTLTVVVASLLGPPSPSENVKSTVRLPAAPATVLKLIARTSCWATADVALALKVMTSSLVPTH